MKKFGLIGHPIAHSASPAVFAAGYAGRPYSYDLIEGEDFEQSWRRFIEEYDGINVTAPFKELAFAKADIRSPECEGIGATNLLVKTAEGIKAYNSDYYGILFSIMIGCGADVSGMSATPSVRECRAAIGGRLHSALVVGCGGAGKAAAAAAVNLGLRTTLMNRTFDKAVSTAERIALAAARDNAGDNAGADAGDAAMDAEARAVVKVRPLDDFAECFEESDLVIYALPCPIDALQGLAAGEDAGGTDAAACREGTGTMTGLKEGEGTDAAEGRRACRKLVIEANYRDPSFNSELVARIRRCRPDIEFMRGNVWHLYQAWSGYILFTGEEPDLAAMAEKDR